MWEKINGIKLHEKKNVLKNDRVYHKSDFWEYKKNHEYLFPNNE